MSNRVEYNDWSLTESRGVPGALYGLVLLVL